MKNCHDCFMTFYEELLLVVEPIVMIPTLCVNQKNHKLNRLAENNFRS